MNVNARSILREKRSFSSKLVPLIPFQSFEQETGEEGFEKKDFCPKIEKNLGKNQVRFSVRCALVRGGGRGPGLVCVLRPGDCFFLLGVLVRRVGERI
jgi:hypothetical protein